MSIEDRKRWDTRHREFAALSPRASLRALPRAAGPTALALDLASGQGRHSRFLRQAGYRVVAMDVSMQALRHARATLGDDGDLLAVQGDVDAWPLAAGRFDVVVQVDFLDRALFPHLRESLRDGGLLFIDTFLDQGRANAEGPSRPEFLLAAGELPREFGDLELLRYDEVRGKTARAVFLGRKR